MERNEMCKSCERKLNTNCYDIWEAMKRSEVHADDYDLCHISDCKQQQATSLSCLTTLIFCRNLKI